MKYRVFIPNFESEGIKSGVLLILDCVNDINGNLIANLSLARAIKVETGILKLLECLRSH